MDILKNSTFDTDASFEDFVEDEDFFTSISLISDYVNNESDKTDEIIESLDNLRNILYNSLADEKIKDYLKIDIPTNEIIDNKMLVVGTLFLLQPAIQAYYDDSVVLRISICSSDFENDEDLRVDYGNALILDYLGLLFSRTPKSLIHLEENFHTTLKENNLDDMEYTEYNLAHLVFDLLECKIVVSEMRDADSEDVNNDVLGAFLLDLIHENERKKRYAELSLKGELGKSEKKTMRHIKREIPDIPDTIDEKYIEYQNGYIDAIQSILSFVENDYFDSDYDEDSEYDDYDE